MRRRLALVLVGAWIAASICSSVVAAENFYTIDRLLAASSNPSFARLVARIGAPEAREFLRYFSSELNRLYFQIWNLAQLVLGVVVLCLLWRPRPLDLAAKLVAAMFAVAALTLVWLTPAIVSLGRALDFVPRDPAPPDMQRFWMLHAAYTSLETIKLAILVSVVVAIIRSAAPESARPQRLAAQAGTTPQAPPAPATASSRRS
jgi:hypothetical protein